MNTNRRDSKNWVPISVAAQRLQTTPLHVLMHIKRAVLLGEEIDDAWMIDAVSLAALIRKRGDGELPVICGNRCSKAGDCSGCG